MKDIIELYNEIKNMEDVDLDLIETYIKFVLKKVKCSNIQELDELIAEKEEEINAFDNTSKELEIKLRNNISEQKKLLNSQIIEYNSIIKKSMLLLLPILSVVGIDVVLVVTLFNIPAVIFAIATILIAAMSGLKLRSRFYTTYKKNEERLNELTDDCIAISNELTNILLKSIELKDTIIGLNAVKKIIADLMETYISTKNSSQDLTQEANIEENMEVVEENEESKILHSI